MKPRFLILFLLLLASSSAWAAPKPPPTPLYTACNLWISDPLLSLNTQTGQLLPAGTRIHAIEIDDEDFTFVTAEPRKTYEMELVPKYHGKISYEKIADRFLTAKPFDELTEGLTPLEIRAIRQGGIAPGMSRRAVAIALGPPPEHRTPSLTESKWVYWSTRRRSYSLEFDAKGLLKPQGIPVELLVREGSSLPLAAAAPSPPPPPPKVSPPPPAPRAEAVASATAPAVATAAPPVQAGRSNGVAAQGPTSLPPLPEGGGQRWAVVVGISSYQWAGKGGLTNLAFADDDAEDFAEMLRKKGWSGSHIKLLVNEKATLREVTIALESWLTKAAPDDLIVLFWSGHGFPDPEDMEKVYFACYDTDITIPATGYRMDKVHRALEERGARNVVVIADTCHAGKIATRSGGKGVAITPHIETLKRQELPKGWVYLVGADTDRQAIEHSSWSNGAFTHVLLDAMGGKADGFESMGPRDGIVTLNELRAYMRTAMPELTQKVLGVAKHPLITTSTGDPTIWDLTLERR